MYNEKNKKPTNESAEPSTSYTNRTVSEINQNQVRVVTNFDEEHIIYK